MSTILESLKKLEQEKEAPPYLAQAPGYRGPGSVQASGYPSSGWSKTTWIRRSLVGLLIVGLGATTLYFYNQSKSPSAIRPDQTSDEQLQAKASPGNGDAQSQPKMIPADRAAQTPQHIDPPKTDGPAPATGNMTPSQNRTPVGDPDNPRPRLIRPSSRPQKQGPQGTDTPKQATRQPAPVKRPPPQSTVAPVPKAPPTPPGKVPTKFEEQLPPTSPEKKQPLNQEPTPVAKPPVALPSQKRPVPTPPAPKPAADAYEDLRPITDGRLKVNAIVWSSEKEDRMAVINSQIVYEGDGVGGFTLVAIRQDDVIVREQGGSLYKVLFGR